MRKPPITLDGIKTITTQIADAMSMPINPANVGQLNLKINRLTLMLAAACHASAMAEWLLTYQEYLVMQQTAYKKLPAPERNWMLKKETRVHAFYKMLTAKQHDALLCALESLTAILTSRCNA